MASPPSCSTIPLRPARRFRPPGRFPLPRLSLAPAGGPRPRPAARDRGRRWRAPRRPRRAVRQSERLPAPRPRRAPRLQIRGATVSPASTTANPSGSLASSRSSDSHSGGVAQRPLRRVFGHDGGGRFGLARLDLARLGLSSLGLPGLALGDFDAGCPSSAATSPVTRSSSPLCGVPRPAGAGGCGGGRTLRPLPRDGRGIPLRAEPAGRRWGIW